MEPTTFVGWMKEPFNKVQFKLSISKTDPSVAIDSMEQVFLDAQADKMAAAAASQESEVAEGKMPAKPKATGDDDENDGEENAKMPAGKMPAMKKAPPSEKPTAATVVYALDGVEVKEGGGYSRTLHGLFRVPASAPENSIFVMTTLQEPSSAAAAGAAMPARKRTRATRSLDDDEEDDDGDEGVGYNELIDLHDDAGLSTEELRLKYYGGGDGGGGSTEPAAKKPKAGQDEEDDDDDAYGF
eukprot:Nitzschia sp. Nitz4//scaffold23_size168460//125545//126270//NITZ4_002240-RA/size168460-processed-gene-0.234-mRNA-1//1//CDS//3329543698//1825//frame0